MSKENSPGSHPTEDDKSFDGGFANPDVDRTFDVSSKDVYSNEAANLSPEERRYNETIGHIKELEQQYREQLWPLLTDCFNSLTAEERVLILENPEIRNRVALALEALGVDDSIGIGSPTVEHEYSPSNPEILAMAERLADNARMVDPYFQREAAQIAWETGSVHIPGTPKEAHRIAEKMELDYSDGSSTPEELATDVKDAVRCRLVIEDDPLVGDLGIIEKIEQSRLTIATDPFNNPRIKRGFWDTRTGEPVDNSEDSRYLDTKVTVTVTVIAHDLNGEEVLCEIAIVTPQMAAATVAEHPLYEIWRAIGTGTPQNGAALLELRSKFRDVAKTFYQFVDSDMR